MGHVPLWFERKFEFSFPVELLPNLCARLRGTRARLEEVLGGSPHALLIARAGASWSAQEHAGHLLGIEPLWLARVVDYIASSDKLTKADLSNQKTNAANHNARPLAQILSEFRTAREILLKHVIGLDSLLLTRAISHPHLQTPMRLVDHLHFAVVQDLDDANLEKEWSTSNGGNICRHIALLPAHC